MLGFEEPAEAPAEPEVVAGLSPVALAREEQLFAPVSGRLTPLSSLSDPVFADEIFGKGIAIVPESGELLSPVNGRIEAIFDSNHALTLRSDCGAEVLIHIGIDTVKLGGQHFTRHVENGAFVEAGQPLISFDLAALNALHIDPSVIVIVTNTDCYGEISPLKQGDVAPREAFLKLTAAAA
ncbi:PTS system, beta-glucoside-specific IIB component / PTS system, beta-glucoside-specific IIC component / PTS system, beta-glucoside-specific IIA component [Cronobacter sakazakii 680]|nr:PTS system, beta-glucoside-specific IIB component / PTS system, beta-glucoside-specific IIC component / PTS system, beta-glucoside-specific IIA component [Cronobacter sakazakii 680]